MIVKDSSLKCFVDSNVLRYERCLVTLVVDKDLSYFKIGVSIAEGKHLNSSRTQQLSPPAANIVPGKLGVKIARCTYF